MFDKSKYYASLHNQLCYYRPLRAGPKRVTFRSYYRSNLRPIIGCDFTLPAREAREIMRELFPQPTLSNT